jgi:hypothetical protein
VPESVCIIPFKLVRRCAGTKKIYPFYSFGMVDKVDVFVKQLYNVFLVVKIGVNGIGAERGNSSSLIG